MYCSTNSNPTVSGCTFAKNKAYIGGGLNKYGNQEIPQLTNCFIWGNESSGSSDSYSGTWDITFSDVEGGASGTGNINSDPSFVDSDNDDFSLKTDSPCIDTGDPNFEPDSGETDIDGQPRVMNGVVDMGADEETGGECSSCKGDLNGDGWIMVGDLFVLNALLGQKGSPYMIDATDPLYNDCGDMNEDDWLMMSDYYILNNMLSEAGPPYIIECP